MGKKIPNWKSNMAILLYDDGMPVKSILGLLSMDSKTLYKYVRIANLKLRMPYFCNRHPKNPRARRNTNEK